MTRTRIELPYGALALSLVLTACAAAEWCFGILGSQEDLRRLLTASRETVFHGEPQRLLTASFFHLSGSHFFGNTLGILIVGGYLEFRVGTPRFVVIALSSAAGSILGSVIVHYVGWVAGASGMLYGIYGALAALTIRYWNDWDVDYPIPRWLAVLGTIALLVVHHFIALRALPEFAIIDHGNHASGFVVGALTTALLTRGCPARSLKRENRRITWIAVALVALFSIGFLTAGWSLWSR